MFDMAWPLIVVILTNFMYQVCTKSMPENMNPLATLVITYVVGAVVAFATFYATTRGGDIVQECAKTNWAPAVLGVVIVFLESSYIMAFKNGWPISLLQIIQSSLLAVLLILAGRYLFNEPVTWNKVLGIFVCLAGMGIIGWK